MTPASRDEEAIKRLEWAIWLSQVNLRAFRDGDWLNLQHDLKEHLGSSFSASIAGVIPLPQEFVERQVSNFGKKEHLTELEALQQALRNDLRRIAYDGAEDPNAVLPVATSAIKNVSVTVQGFQSDQPFALDISVGSATGLMIQRALYGDLVASTILRGQLRSCPVCKRIFLIKRKPRPDMQFHCSLKCSRLAATRRYRKKIAAKNTESVKAKERERSRRRYEGKQKQKHGPNVKVGRRPRKA